MDQKGKTSGKMPRELGESLKCSVGENLTNTTRRKLESMQAVCSDIQHSGTKGGRGAKSLRVFVV